MAIHTVLRATSLMGPPLTFDAKDEADPALESSSIDETDASHFMRRPAAHTHRTHAAHNAGSHYGLTAAPFWRWRLA